MIIYAWYVECKWKLASILRGPRRRCYVPMDCPNPWFDTMVCSIMYCMSLSYNLLSSKHFRSFFLDHFGSNILGLNMFFVRINISTFRFSPSKKFLQLLYGPKVVIKIFIGTKSWRKILEGPKQKFSIFIETKNIFNPTF